MMTGKNHNRDVLVHANHLFDIHEMIGSGSFSNVYRATYKETNRNIALKVFKRKSNDPNQYTRAGTEIAFLKILIHPNIISFEVCEVSRYELYLGVEYSACKTLGVAINQNDYLSEAYIKLVMKQLLLALDYLHNMNICHGDIKPENIILFDDYHNGQLIKLTDFGLAEVLMDNEKETRRGGSFYYMAPELHLKFPFDVTSDLFSAGIVMYELIFKQLPFNKSVSKEYHISLLRKRTKLIKFNDILNRPGVGISSQCIDLLERLLDYDKHQRPRGSQLRTHPFINLGPSTPDTQNHYIIGCECMVQSFDMLRNKELGKAFIKANEGILHLKIHTMAIKADEGLFTYMQCRLEEYEVYCKHIEDLLNDQSYSAPLYLTFNNEKLRCVLSSSPNLLTGYDICCVGEMYIRQRKYDLGRNKLQEGLDILIKQMAKEPSGNRKNLLLAKIEEWISMMEQINPKIKQTPEAAGH